MKIKLLLLKTLNWTCLLLVFFITGCSGPKESPADNSDEFNFVFMTDIHLQPEENAVEGFKLAIDSINKLNPDFVITGGDLIMDALEQNYGRADSLYQLYLETIKYVEAPVYNTMGNHEVFAWYKTSGADTLHPKRGKTIFQNRIGKTYYSFDHKGWHFLILDSVEESEDDEGYIGKINKKQMEWIREDLSKVGKDVPICVSVHIPMITIMTQIFYYGTDKPIGPGLVIDNFEELFELFEEYNIKVVLQGHTHYLEDINLNGIHFITSGAISGRWWTGPLRGCEEGFLLLKVKGEDFDWEYVDYGWEVEAEVE